MSRRTSPPLDPPDAATRDRASEYGLAAHADIEEVLAATRQLIARDRGLLGALRARPTWQRVAAVFAVFLASAASMSGGELRTELWLHALLFGAGSCLLLWPLGRPAPVRMRMACLVAALALPAAFAAWVHVRGAYDALGRSPWPCLAYGLLLAGLFWSMLKAFDRSSAIGAERALLAGSVAGLAGNALLHLHCADGDLAHVLLGHALLAFPCAGLAYRLGYRRGPDGGDLDGWR